MDNTLSIKIQLQKLIATEEDPGILNEIYSLLKRSKVDSQLKTKLTARARRAEDDIQSGRLYSEDEIIKLLGDLDK